MQLEGALEQFPLTELITMITASSVTGVLELRFGSSGGQIFFRDGQPYHATADNQHGFEAVCTLFEQTDATFRFRAGIECNEQSLHFMTDELIARAAEQAEQWRQVRAVIPDLDWVPLLLQSAPVERIQISDLAWQALTAVDGQRSVAEMAEALSQLPLDICLGLCDLIRQGLVRLTPPRTPRPQRIAAGPARREPRNFLDRLIAEATAGHSGS